MWRPRQGATLDIAEWLAPRHGRTQGVIVSVAHFDDEERALVLGVILEEVLSWVRTLPGSPRLRALVVFDEVYGFMDYRALGNAGLWLVGRLQTDADRALVIDGLSDIGGGVAGAEPACCLQWISAMLVASGLGPVTRRRVGEAAAR